MLPTGTQVNKKYFNEAITAVNCKSLKLRLKQKQNLSKTFYQYQNSRILF